MKKGLKIFLIVAGAVVLLLGLAVGLLFVPGVQKKIVLSALGREAARLDVYKARLGLEGIRLTDLHMELRDGTVVALDAAKIDAPLLDLVLKKRYVFGRVELEGLEVDLRRRNSDKPFAGVLTALPADSPVSVAELVAEGRVVFAEDAGLGFSASGAIEAGQESAVSVQGVLSHGEDRYEFKGSLGLSGSDEAGVDGLSLDVGVDLSAGEVVAAISAEAKFEEGREAYLLGAVLEKGAESLELFTGNGSYDVAEGRAQFSLNGRAVREQLLAFAPQLVERLPEGLLVDFHLEGGTHEGSWRVEAGNVDASMEGMQISVKMLQPFTQSRKIILSRCVWH